MNRTIACLLLSAAGLLIPGRAAAQLVTSLNILPVIASLAGEDGSHWMTDLSVCNVSTVAVTVRAQFFKEDSTNIPLFVPSHRFDLDPGETLTVEDVMGAWFPGQVGSKGYLLLLAEAAGGGEEPVLVAATSRIFNNADPAATYGQTVPSALLHAVMGRARAVLPGARWDGRARSNVGVANLSLSAIDVLVTVFAADGSVLATGTRRVKAFSLSQWSLSQLGVGALSTPGRVEVRLDPATITWDPCSVDLGSIDSLRGVFIAYMSRIDRATGDAEMILGQNDWTEYVDECGQLPLGGL